MFIKPMLLDTAKDIFDSDEYIYEPKSNGVRMELITTDNEIKLYTRHGNEITSSLPEITQLDIPDGMILDGELVCYSDATTEDFEAVMARIKAKSERKINELMKDYPCTYIVFDILQHKNEMVARFPLTNRIELLEQVVENQDNLRKVVRTSNGTALFELIKQHQLEGVVAKKLTSTYHIGKRPKDLWLKIINWRYSDCYIVGYHKDEFGWVITDNEGNYLGVVEFGASPDSKKEFYKKAVDTGEKNSTKSIDPLPCIVKHRGYLKSGKLFTPVFVSFI